MKTAFVHDWLPVLSGAEHVLKNMLAVTGPAEVFTLFDFLNEVDRAQLGASNIHTSYLNDLPLVENFYRWLFPFCPSAIERFDLSDYDMIVSSSAAFAKGIICHPHQRHVAYVHTPVRYAWDQTFEYLRSTKLRHFPFGMLLRHQLHTLRNWDVRTAHGPDLYLANSTVVQRRIEQTYGRKAVIIHPPVEIEKFTLRESKDDYFVVASRLVPYKRVDLVVEAFRKMPEHKLVVMGDGPQFAELSARAAGNITFLGHVARSKAISVIQNARAFVFAAYEDFGIVLAEAQSAGTPVIAYARGGAADIVVPLGSQMPTGILFDHQTVNSICSAVQQFTEQAHTIVPRNCRANAERFSVDVFRKKFQVALEYVNSSDFRRDTPISI